MVVDDAVDEPELVRLVGHDRVADDVHLEALAVTDEPRQPLRATEPGDDPELDLGLAEERCARGDAQVAGHRELAAAAEGNPVDGGDRGDGPRGELAGERVGAAQEVFAAALVERGEGLDVGAGGEEERVRGGDHERAHAGVPDLRPDLLEVGDEVGRDGVHLPVGEPGDGDAVAASLELDDLGWLLGVGLRVGIEALAALLPEAPLGDEPAQDGGRREPRAMALLRVLHALEDSVEAVGVGAHERRQQPAAGVEPGAGHHPEVDVAVRRDALLEHEAGLDEGLQREELYEFGNIGLGVSGNVGFALWVVEAVSPRLRPEFSVGDELLHALGDVEAFLAVGVDEVLGDVEDGVEAEQVAEVVGADGHDAGGGDAVVDALDRETLLLLLAPHL